MSADVLGRGFGHETRVLVVGHGLGLVDEHDRDVVLDVVAPLQSWVVERVLIREIQQRPFVLGTRKDLEQLGIEGHQVASLWAEINASSSATWCIALLAGRSFEVESE